MSTNVNKLKVSLTKHGAHKIAYLIREFDKDQIINNIDGRFNGIKIELAQAKKNLSVDSNNVAPEFWNQIKAYGDEDIYDLVFIAITFSHKELISAIETGFEDGCTIHRGKILDGKSFTNYAHIIEELGFAIEHNATFVTFDISRIFYKFYLPPLISELLGLKLNSIGWDHHNTLIDECLVLGWNNAFGLNAHDFSKWLGNAEELNEVSIAKVKAKRQLVHGIQFKKGHNTKLEGEIQINTSAKQRAELLHNKIQNHVFNLLCDEYPDHEIGTEIKTNVGSVDIVRKINDDFYFYEIKTAATIKTNIRQALSQLLEYAYWNNIEGNIIELTIIAPCAPNQEAIQYLNLLRDYFHIPINYRYFNVELLQFGGTI